MVGSARHRFLGGRFARRQDRRRFRRPHRFLRARWRDPGDSALHRVDQQRAQIHVGCARRRAHQARGGGQVGPPCARREGGSDAYRRARGSRRGLRRRVSPRRLVAGARSRRVVRRGGDARTGTAVSGRAAGDIDQRRRGRRARRRSARRSRRDSRRALTGDSKEARRGAAADLVARQPGRHRRRRRCGALPRRIRNAAGGPGERRHPGHERSDRARVGRRRRKIDRRLRADASQQLHPTKARVCRVGRKQRRHHADLRSSRHSELCHRIRRGPRLHASRALSAGAGGVDGDAAELGAGLQAGRPRCPPRGRDPGAPRPHPARSDRDHATPCRQHPSTPPPPAAARPFLAEGLGVVVKILSPDIVHKSEVGGVRLNLTSERAVRDAVVDILSRARAVKPDARITGVTIHPMVLRPKARELIAGIADDPTFGPVIVFGRGGTAVEVIGDKALALPPLDLTLARELIGRTRVSRVLKAYRDVPAADVDAIALLLVKLAQLAADLPELRELDLNPVLADQNGLIAVDARIAVAAVEAARRGPPSHPRFAIRPYPKEWERHTELRDGTKILVRPLRPEDEPLYGPFLAAVTQQDLRLRFFAPVKEFGHTFVARFTQIDYARAMAFIAIEESSGMMLGVVRLHADANYERGEYANLVRSDLKGRGLGYLLMQMIIEYARTEGLGIIEGQVLAENTAMLAMCRELGFSISPDPNDPDTCIVKLVISADGSKA